MNNYPKELQQLLYAWQNIAPMPTKLGVPVILKRLLHNVDDYVRGIPTKRLHTYRNGHIAREEQYQDKNALWRQSILLMYCMSIKIVRRKQKIDQRHDGIMVREDYTVLHTYYVMTGVSYLVRSLLTLESGFGELSESRAFYNVSFTYIKLAAGTGAVSSQRGTYKTKAEHGEWEDIAAQGVKDFMDKYFNNSTKTIL